jgi:hypothetical protein
MSFFMGTCECSSIVEKMEKEKERQMKKRYACSMPLYCSRLEFLINFMGYPCVHAE